MDHEDRPDDERQGAGSRADAIEDPDLTVIEDCRPRLVRVPAAKRRPAPPPTLPPTFACPGCGFQFVLGGLHPDNRYRCVHCRADIAPQVVESSASTPGPSWSGVRPPRRGVVYLYGRPSQRLAALTADAAIGVVGRYRVDAELGRGGMGAVYRAWDLELARPVALKVLLAGRFADPTAVARFSLEARAAAGLDHRAIVRILDVGEVGGQVFYAMDLVEGVPLHQVLATAQLPLEETLRIATELARAVETAHTAGVVHRDIKPPNVLLSTDGRVYLTDFGLAKDLHGEDRTATGAMLGTPSYMAPELAEGRTSVDLKLADQYSLGAVLYEMATGHRAYRGTGAVKVLASVIESAPPHPRSVRPDLHRDVEVICLTAMAREPGRRYPSVGALADDLERFVSGHPIEARAASLAYRGRLFVRRNRKVLSGVLATVVAASAILGGSLAWRHHGEQQRWREREREARERLAVVERRIAELIAADRLDEVDTLFASFAEADEHQATSALAEAWLGRAGRQAGLGDGEAELDALAQAYTLATTDGLRERALWGLAAAFSRRGWHDRLDTVAAAMPGTVTTTDLVLAAALARRDLASAMRHLEAGHGGTAVAPMVRALARVTEVGHTTSGHSSVVGERRIAFPVADPDPVLRTVTPDGEVVAESLYPGHLGLPWDWKWVGSDDRTRGLIVSHHRLAGGELVSLLDQRGRHMTEALTWPERSLISAAVLPGAAHDPPTVLVGTGPYTRTVLALERGVDGWRRRALGADLGLVDSDIYDLLFVDLTGDGRDELVVAAGPWTAYDVRVYRQLDGGFERLARRRLGTVVRVRPFRLGGERVLAVAKAHLYPSAEVFPADRPYGEPAGIYLLALVGGELEIRAHLPLPHDLLESGDMFLSLEVGDFDGDGLDDLALFSPLAGNTVIIQRQLSGGGFAELRLGEVLLADVGQLDDDPAVELVVTIDDRLWVLGRGSAVLPPLPQREIHMTPAPATLEKPLIDDWERAERLAAMGLETRAAVALERIAALATEPDAAARSLLRAGRLWTAGGDPARAAQSFLGAAASPQLEAEALLAAVRAQERDQDFAAAAASAARLLQRDDLDPAILGEARRLATAVASLVDPGATTELTFAAPLGPGWHISDPLSVRRDARTSELVIDSWVAERGEIVSFPLERVSDDLSLSLDLRFERNEWASGIRFRLRPEGSTAAGMGVETFTWGGGGYLRDVAGCFVPRPEVGWTEASRPFWHEIPEDLPGAGMRASVVVSPALGESVCRLLDHRGREVYREAGPIRELPTERSWELVVEARGLDDLSHPLSTRARVARLRLGGFRPGDRPGLADPGALAWAEGDSLTAAATLADPLARALALAELGRWERVGLTAADLEPWRFGVALRVRPHLAQALFRRVLGRDFYRLWAAAFLAQVGMVEDHTFAEGIPGQLAGLDEIAVDDPLRPALLQVRGIANREAGRLGAATADLERAVEGALAAGDADAASESYRHLALIAAESGDASAARRHARRSIEVAPFPELAGDLLRRDPTLAALLAAN